VFRASFEAPPNAGELAPLKLVFGHIDDTSIVYLNGEKIGETRDWNIAHRFDLTSKVKPGRNVVALVVANTDGPGGVSHGVSSSPRHRR
jgi:beta-galactosidase/beta-glucuronidase